MSMNGYHARPNGQRRPSAPPPRRHPALPPLKTISDMQERGKVSFFDRSRGYGFIKRDGQEDVFVHRSVVDQYGLTEHQLEAGTPVRFWIDSSRGRGPAAGAIAIA